MKHSRFHISLYIIVPFIFAGFSIFSALIAFRITKYSLAQGADPAAWVFWSIIVIGTLAYAAGFAMVRFILRPVEEFVEKASRLPAFKPAANPGRKRLVDRQIGVHDRVNWSPRR
jgi:hypothetical protein